MYTAEQMTIINHYHKVLRNLWYSFIPPETGNDEFLKMGV